MAYAEVSVEVNEEIDMLMARLAVFQDQFPAADTRRVLELQDQVVPRLVSVVRDAAVNPSALDNGQWLRFAISLYSLAWFRDPTAFPDIIKICNFSRDDADDLLGDALLEDLHKILGATFNGDWESLRCVLADQSLNEFVRDRVLWAHLVLYKSGRISRENLIAYLKSLFSVLGDDSFMVTCLAHCCMCIHAAELSSEIRTAFASGLIDVTVVDLEGIEDAWANSRTRSLEVFRGDERFDLPSDPVEHLRWWPGHQVSEEGHDEVSASRTDPQLNPWRDVGRNDPCPCGSGKKFKKCHLGAPQNLQ